MKTSNPTTWLSSPAHPIFLFRQLKTKLKGYNFDNCGDRDRIAGSAERLHRTWLPGSI
jgi:hypothetical protein